MRLGEIAEALVLIAKLSHVHSLILVNWSLLPISLGVLPFKRKVEAHGEEDDQTSQAAANRTAFGIEGTVFVSLVQQNCWGSNLRICLGEHGAADKGRALAKRR